MSDLTAWILERIAEDESVAQAALAHEAALREVKPNWDYIWTWALMYNAPGGGGGHGFHPDAPDPARVLAQCAALREIVALYQDEEPAINGWAAHQLHEALRALAAIWADHDDFDPAWRLT